MGIRKTHHYIVTAIPPKDKRKEIVIDEKLVLAYEKGLAARCIQNKKLKENSSFMDCLIQKRVIRLRN